MEDIDIKGIINEVSDSMEKAGYDPITQLVGYFVSNDLGYIPDFDDNRNKISKLDITSVLESMMKEYLK